MLQDYELKLHKDKIKKIEEAIREVRPNIADILKSSIAAIISHYDDEIKQLNCRIIDCEAAMGDIQ